LPTHALTLESSPPRAILENVHVQWVLHEFAADNRCNLPWLEVGDMIGESHRYCMALYRAPQ